MTAAAPRLRPGSVVHGRYEVLGPVGAGGMATTHLARDLAWGARVALKVLSGTGPELAEALHLEFAVLKSLSHPRLVRVRDLGRLELEPTSEPVCFYAADFIEGATLDAFALGRSWEAVRTPLVDALDALRALHAAGFRHGDFKPANVLVDGEGRGTLIDLGCARPIGGPAGSSLSGTSGYLAPELLAGRAADGRADLYAVGVALGRLESSLASPLPEDLRRLASRLREPDPAARPADVEAVLHHLGVETSLVHPVVARLGRLAGRAEELRRARDALEALAEGRPGPRVVQLAGPDGMGRSRLLQEVRWIAEQRTRVLEARATAEGALASLLGLGLGAPSPATLEAALRCRDLAAQGRAGPVVWVVDDAHRLDGEGRELLGALARSAAWTDAALLAVASDPELVLEGEAVLRLELGPLGAAELADWLGGTVSPRAERELLRLSGGSPAALRSLLQRIASADAAEEELGRDGGTALLPAEGRSAALATLGAEERRGLGLLAVLGGALGGADLDRLGLEGESLDRLVARGLAEREGAGWKLLRLCEADGLVAALEPDLVLRLHGEVAELVAERRGRVEPGGASDAELAADLARHLVLAGRKDAASALLLATEDLHGRAPRAWLRAAAAVAAGTAEPAALLAVARVELAAGRAGLALERLEEVLAAEPEGPMADAVRVELGACELRLGRPASAILRLEPLAGGSGAGELVSRASSLLARALSAEGRYAEAARLAVAALGRCEAPLLRADLAEAAGLALSFSGDPDGARAMLDTAAGLSAGSEDPRRLVRALGSRGVLAYSVGDLERASQDHRRALVVAEEAGLSDQVATAALNLGTACHQRGTWAEAQASYERGLRMAVALGQRATEAHIRFDLAKLHADLGLGDRALLAAESCREVAEAAGLELLVAAADTVRAEVALARGETERAARLLEANRPVFEERGSQRELAELELALGEVALAERDLEAAAAALGRSEHLLAGLGAADVELRLGAAWARLRLAEGRAEEALAFVEGAAEKAAAMGQQDLEAELELVAASVWQARGAGTVASRHRTRARELWERAAAPLPAATREAFLAHPRRRGAAETASAPKEPSSGAGAGERERRLRLLLDINKRLNSSLRTDDVLRHAMDAAIELTRAERGFVLLAREPGTRDKLEVAVARNLDREQLARSGMKFSRGIAEQVLETGRPVLTADALSDGRFDAQASVHAMALKSVLCVPVRSPAGVLGALYLDNRFQRGQFGEGEVEVLLALADQVAIALTNARLVGELGRQNRELEAARERADERARGQAAEIDRLNEEVRRRTVARERRFDYGAIVGSSRAMEEVFALLDRVIDTDLPVLIQGESGTGKELVARAVHANSRKSRGPLVSVNCGALPESLLESELFGHERGAFSGADRAREGLVVKAAGGTLFLDEVAETSPAMQVKLLRVLQEREVQPLGSTRVVPVDFRLVSATNRGLREEVERGGFREDLYFRVAAVEVRLPPLRERPEDLPELVQLLLGRAAASTGAAVPELSRAAMRKLAGHGWPGNVRELEHVLARALVMSEGGRIEASDLELPGRPRRQDVQKGRESYLRAEVDRIAEALEASRWNVSEVSRLLGIPRPTLYRRIRRFGIEPRRG